MSTDLAGQIELLIEADPRKLHIGASTEYVSAYAREVLDAAEVVLEVYKQSRSLELDKHQRKMLRRRLLNAAHQVQILIDEDDFNGRRDRLVGQRNIQLFGRIAVELQMEPQELQVRA